MNLNIILQSFIVLLVPILLMKGFGRINAWVHSFPAKRKKQSSITNTSSNVASSELTGQYVADMALIRAAIGKNADVKSREFMIQGFHYQAAVIYVEGLTDLKQLHMNILNPLMMEGVKQEEKERFLHSGHSLKVYLEEYLLLTTELLESRLIDELTENILVGHTALIVDGVKGAFLVQAPSGVSRTVEEPLSEALLRGPRIGFTEKLSENMGLLRIQGKNNSLFFSGHEIGERTKKKMVIAYMQDIVDPMLVTEVERRISRIHIDDVLESGYIEQLIEDDWMSPFQQVQNTERPDRVMSALLEGRVAILLEGTPFALILPVTFSMLLQSPEDYYERWIGGSSIRLLRFGAALLALLAPALYISFISFHPGLIPTKLALSIIKTRQGVPFPSIIEALIMEVALEILREAGIRLPKPIGPAMGIVGGLIIGDAAVRAGIVSPFLVIIVAVTAISSFTIPMYSAGITLRFLRFLAMISAALFGLYGVIMFFLLLCSHLVRLKSFGVPYATPLIPYKLSDWKDFFVRAPLQLMKQRPTIFKNKDKDRA
ncbi:spore germination protein [Paenibacillus sp. Marseille-Q4541]|uniref:spore germination protein n=1 Tax=Paenibacillus sp. Marseille-Q4541 TaxID=2831522 RepID=UPI001BAA8551|nr:spore germination protein [Paenibacillus sp. Marseille-Q4541]